jgi:hypothetical protein
MVNLLDKLTMCVWPDAPCSIDPREPGGTPKKGTGSVRWLAHRVRNLLKAGWVGRREITQRAV